MQHGENDTYVVDTSNGKYILRRYRQGRYTVDQVRAEIAWIDMLRDFITVPRIIKNTYEDSVSRFDSPNEECLYVVFEYVDGDTIFSPTESDYQNLGRLMRWLHTNADFLFDQVTTDWEGWNRPKYDLHLTVEIPLRRLLEFGVLTDNDRKRCVKIAQELKKRFDILSSSEQFVHADLHFGNILVTPDSWYCLDFDECGFGHRAIDIGVIRLHLKSRDRWEEYWLNFKEGYGSELSDEEISLGTAVRIFYMAGKIPIRQDIDDLRIRPEERIRRYLGYIESEIFLK